ncbi:MAG: peptide-methionine (S)-S-oxide reductase [Zetaproteobacteria bacterium]|nr:MAG: peptide-methionine (S)-S-oxide reductase [Zetaproteobacteria bacterium]
MTEKPDNYPVATLAGGCFWCLESEFRALDGILHTRVGYIGGNLQQPSYQDITTGKTGHAEAVEITFDPDKVSYEQLVTFFLTKAHNPTTLNRQGVDVGTQYRSEIFYHNDKQRKIAEHLINTVDTQTKYKAPIVTKLSPADKFWLGEDYHQQYYEKYEKDKGQIHPRVYFKRQSKKMQE